MKGENLVNLVQNSSVPQHLDPFLSVYLHLGKWHIACKHILRIYLKFGVFWRVHIYTYTWLPHLYLWGLSGSDIMVKYAQCRIKLFFLKPGGVIQLRELHGVCKDIWKHGYYTLG